MKIKVGDKIAKYNPYNLVQLEIRTVTEIKSPKTVVAKTKYHEGNIRITDWKILDSQTEFNLSEIESKINDLQNDRKRLIESLENAEG